MILPPKMDTHTIALVDFTRGYMIDRARKLTWGTFGGIAENDAHIIVDGKVGRAFSGLNGGFYSANISKYLPNNHDVTMECWFNCSSAPFHGSGLMQLADRETYADDNPNGTYSRCGLQFYNPSNGASSGGLRWDRCRWNFCDAAYTFNTWHHVAFVKSGSYHRGFLDGRLIDSRPSSTKPYGSWFLIGQGWTGTMMDAKCKMAQIRLSDIARYSGNFDPCKIYRTTAAGMFISKTSCNFSDAVGSRAFRFGYGDVANTRRRAVFKVDNVWYKLSIPANKIATLVKVPTQAITTASVLNEGNTAAEINSVVDVPAFANKVVTPAVALDMNENAKMIPWANFYCNYKTRT